MTRALDPKSEAEIARLAAQYPWMTMRLRRRLALSVAVIFLAAIGVVPFALIFWPRDHAATLFMVAVTTGIVLLLVTLAVLAPRRLSWWMARARYVSDEDARKPTVIS